MSLKIKEDELKKVIKSISDINDAQRLEKAYMLSKKAHNWQKRKSWEDYIIHPISVWLSLWNKYKNIDLLICWLLHDTVEDCNWILMSQIYETFWSKIWFIIDSVTKTEKSFLWEDYIFEDEREKILFWWLKDISCIILKLADREHNLSTLSHMPKNKQIKKSFESQAIYLPLIDILDFKSSNTSLDEAENNLNSFLKDNKITDLKHLKNTLLNTCFHDFSDDIFNIIYKNSTNVVWEINDKKLFNSLIDDWWFDSDSVEIRKIESTWKWKFTAYFVFISWSTFDFSSWKISVSSSRFIS